MGTTQAAPVAVFAIEPLYKGDWMGKGPFAYGIYRRNRHGWYRVAEKPTNELAQIKMKQLQERFTNVQTSDTTRPDEA
jgi:hypothetical protein